MRTDPQNRSSVDPHSKKNSYGTPDEVFDSLDAEFHFNIDGAANKDNAKVTPYLGPGGYAEDAFKQEWSELSLQVGGEKPVVFVNPPYGRGLLRLWVAKAIYERDRGVTTVMLLPVAPETGWFKHAHKQADEIRWLPSRIQFIHPDTGEPVKGNMHASCLAVFYPYGEGPARYRYQNID